MTLPGPPGSHPDPGSRRPGGPLARGGAASNPVWWVVAALAVVVALALIVWLVVTGMPGATPSVTTSPSTVLPSSDQPGSPDPTTPNADQWGEFPPNHLESAKDLSDPQFPEKISTFILDSKSADAGSVVARYDDVTNVTGVSAWLLFGTSTYRDEVESLTDVGYHGDAVCGQLIDFPDQVKCLMVGSNEILSVSTASDLTIESIAALTQELYESL